MGRIKAAFINKRNHKKRFRRYYIKQKVTRK